MTDHWNRVQAAFDDALERSGPDREAFLVTLAAVEPDIAREVRSLLASHERASGFLGGNAAADLGHFLASGDRIGPYRILEETGRGGMGVVFRAVRDDENFTREVAIKLVYPGPRSDDILKRFRAERQILAMLDHPFIARLIDGGTTPDGTPFLVMDFVAGQPLLKYCDDQSLDIDARLRLFLKVCDAVQFAHQRLVIHRDLKPDNILVTADGTPRLLDFGIARLMSPDGEGLVGTVTAPMNRLLTPDYASPEQVRGDPVTVAGDVYSLGVILYEVLSGRRPLEFVTRTPEEILRIVLQEEPAPPSLTVARAATEQAAIRRRDTTARLRRRLAGDLDYITLKALEKDPLARYGSVDQMAQDIRRHLTGQPVLARGGSALYLASRFVRRHRVAVVTASLVALSLAAGLAGTTWQGAVARSERDRATRRFDEVRSLAHAVVFDIHDAIADLPGSTGARETLVEHALTYLNSLAAEARGDWEMQHELGVAYAKIGDVQGRPMFPNLGQTAEARGSYDKALALLDAASAAQPDSLDVVRDWIVTTQRLADLLRKMGRNDEAMARARAALDRLERELERRPDHPDLNGDLVLAHDRIGDMMLAAADTQGAIAERRFCMTIAEEMFRRDPRDTGWRRSVIINSVKTGELMTARHDSEGALASYRKAESLAREAVDALGHNTEARRDLSIVYGITGLFLAGQGQLDSGLVVYDRGMQISEEMAADDPRNTLAQADVASGHFEIGGMLLSGKRYAAAESRLGEAFARYSALAAADSADVESRLAMARSGRLAGDACRAQVSPGPAGAEHGWWTRALDWYERSRTLYVALEAQGALTGDEAAAPADLSRQVAELRRER